MRNAVTRSTRHLHAQPPSPASSARPLHSTAVASAWHGRAQRGITPFELVACLALVTLVCGAIGWLYATEEGASDATRAEATADSILRAAEQWRLEHSRGCPTLTELIRDDRLPQDSVTDDPWGGRFRVRCEGDRLTVWSPGRDGTPSTADDVALPRG